MRNKVRYKDYRIGDDVYTVKLTLRRGGFVYNPAVRVQIMEWHQPPRNLWERIIEWWKYIISEYNWDPVLDGASLDNYCIDKCNLETMKRIAIERGSKEWEAL